MARGISRTGPSVRKPHFFKVLLGDFKHRLKIPTKFMKYIGKQASRRVILQGPNRSSWEVELRETITGTFLSAGWSKFVTDHSLKKHEFLVFRYNGNMHFNVMMFDTTACEREDVFEMKTPICESKMKRGHPAKRSLDANCIVQYQSSRSKFLMLPSNNKHESKQLPGECSSPTSNAVVQAEDVALQIVKPKWHTSYLSNRRPVTAEERLKAEKTARSFYSPFPCTIIRMTAANVYNVFLLKFPPSFSEMHLPQNKTNMFLRDPSGKTWKVVYIPFHQKRQNKMYSISGGWSAFARGNYLEEGDFCAFELIGELELRVHIFRVVEETIPLTTLTVKRYAKHSNCISGM